MLKNFKYSLLLIILSTILMFCKKNIDKPKTFPININYCCQNFITYEGLCSKQTNSTILSADSNLIICGSNNYYNSKELITYIIKVSLDGELIWRREFNIDNSSVLSSSISETNDNCIILCGTYMGNDINENDIFVFKINQSGSILWERKFISEGNEKGFQIIRSLNNTFLISGFKGTNNGGDILVYKLTSENDLLWTKNFPINYSIYSQHLVQLRDGSVLITASPSILLKIDNDGNKLWEKESLDKLEFSSELNDLTILTCGSNSKMENLYISKRTPNGDIIWQNQITEENNTLLGTSLKVNNDNSITVVGSAYNNITDANETFLYCLDKDGKKLWGRIFGGSATDYPINLIKCNNEDNIITGITYSCVGNIYFTKLDKNGNFITENNN